MSKNINVNPDYYKTAGREPQGQDVVHEVQKQQYAQAEKMLRKREQKAKVKTKKT